MLFLEALKLFGSGGGAGHHALSGIDRGGRAALGIGIKLTIGVSIPDPEPLRVLQLFLEHWGQLSHDVFVGFVEMFILTRYWASLH